MAKPNDSAFPIVYQYAADSYGLTKRELFAAMAMQGVISGGLILSADKYSAKLGIKPEEAVALAGLAFADALIAELGKEK